MLCSMCRQVLQEPAKADGTKGFSAEYKCETAFSAIRESEKSCFGCRTLWRRIHDADFGNGSDDTNLGITFELASKDSSPEGNITLKITARHEPSNRDFWIQAIVEEISPPEPRRLYAVTTDSTGSEETLRFVGEKLAECESSHHKCRLPTTSSTKWYPTRLVQLTDSGPRLIETRDHVLDGPYATLSHRWGGSDITTCTTDTKGDLEAGISSSFLTRTFRDALHAIEKLGINYIWIDSLCIIQDSAEDWTREALTMGKVYQHSHLTLSATRAENSETGLFAPRNPDLMSSGPFRIDNGVLSGDFVAVEDAMGANWGYWDREVQLAPLNSRGWVMQERLLSRRVVHFAAEQVFWDCGGSTASETRPGGLSAAQKAIWVDHKQSSSLLAAAAPDEAAREAMFGEWFAVVNAYTNCHFTVAADKLIALAGVAAHLRGALGYAYLAGLWRRQLELQLCWSVVRKDRPAARNPVAPSWSWASVDGLAEMLPSHCYRPGFPATLRATVADAAVEQVRGRRGGAYKGYITMRCFLGRVTVEAAYPDRPDRCMHARLAGAGAEFAKQVDVDTPDVINAEGLFLAPIFEIMKPHLMKRHCAYAEMRALLLKVVDEEAGTFERCGHVLLEASNFPAGVFKESWVDLTRAGGKDRFPCIEYDEEAGHLIKIV